MNVAGQTSNVSRSAVIPARQNPPDLRRYPSSSAPQQPKLLDRLREALRSRHYSRRTEQCYRHVLGREVGDLGDVIRARRPHHLPVVMTREEVKSVLACLPGDKWLMAS